MKRRLLTTLLIAVVFLSGCAAPQTLPAEEETAPAVTSAATEETEAVAEAPSGDETASVDYCIKCHTDKDALIANAKPEEEVPEESEGVG